MLSFAISILTSERSLSSLFRYICRLTISTVVLLSWIYIIYDRNFKIALSLGSLYVMEVAAVITILGISLRNLEGVKLSTLCLGGSS